MDNGRAGCRQFRDVTPVNSLMFLALVAGAMGGGCAMGPLVVPPRRESLPLRFELEPAVSVAAWPLVTTAQPAPVGLTTRLGPRLIA